MEKRKTISKKTRFEVFKRDSFKCQYCGKSSPDVILEIDHIKPVCDGGLNEMINLVTACFDCNRGKGKRKVSNKKQAMLEKEELEKLKNRKEQTELYVKWKKELIESNEIEFEKLQELFGTVGREWNEIGKKDITKLIKKYGFKECYDSLEICIEQYKAEEVSVKLPKVLASRKLTKENPELNDLYYIRGIIRKRFAYINEYESLDLMKEAYSKGATIDNLKYFAKECRNWTQWVNSINAHIKEL